MEKSGFAPQGRHASAGGEPLTLQVTAATSSCASMWPRTSTAVVPTQSGDSLTSTYSFCKDVLGYDLAGFFRRHQAVLQKDVEGVLEGLLR